MTKVERARRLFQSAYKRHMAGEIERALQLYDRSIELHATAEAHTFRAWALSQNSKYAAAISGCKQAIELDPDYGNPYNDIGSYLIELGRYDEAEGWLRKAIDAPRYDVRHYAWYNLGRTLERRGALREAVEAYRNSLDLEPEFLTAYVAANRVIARMN